jgi:hypothetical protein
MKEINPEQMLLARSMVTYIRQAEATLALAQLAAIQLDHELDTSLAEDFAEQRNSLVVHGRYLMKTFSPMEEGEPEIEWRGDQP